MPSRLHVRDLSPWLLSALAFLAACAQGSSSSAPGGLQIVGSLDGGGADKTDAAREGGACPTGESACATACANLTSDPHHCGACETDCTTLPGVNPGTIACVAGQCNFAAGCQPSRAHCSPSPSTGCETDLTSAKSCGGCATQCAGATPDCSPATAGGSYACSSTCLTGTTACGSSCIDLTKDPLHCGSCTNPCPAPVNGTATCQAGACGATCNPGDHECGGACVDSTNPATCGAMCSPCPAPANALPACTAGSCSLTCNPGYANCDGNATNGCEANLQTSAGNCGMCGHACGGGTPNCSLGMCSSGCGAGLSLCGASCVNESTDPANCGGCAMACPGISGGTATCSGGHCGVTCNPGSHMCGSACDSNTSVNSCGTSCTGCPTATNAGPTCNGTSCGIACNAGYSMCLGQSACLADTTSTLPTGTGAVSPTGNASATMFNGASVSCLCVESVYYTACHTFNYSSSPQLGPGWVSAASTPSGCDYNACTGPGGGVGVGCQQNFCQPCPGNDPTMCNSLHP